MKDLGGSQLAYRAWLLGLMLRAFFLLYITLLVYGSRGVAAREGSWLRHMVRLRESVW